MLIPGVSESILLLGNPEDSEGEGALTVVDVILLLIMIVVKE